MEILKMKKGIIITIVLVSFFIGYLFHSIFYPGEGIYGSYTCNTDIYKYINPNTDCLNSNQTVAMISSLRENVESYIKDSLTLNKAKRISVFYRDLNSKKWFGVNQSDLYSPGSLLKLPLAVAYYKLKGVDDYYLSKEIIYKQVKPSYNSLMHFKNGNSLVDGQKYSLSDLINQMIVYSDNDVLPALVGSINNTFYEKVLVDLNIHIPVEEDNDVNTDFFSTVTYSNILRALYNSSYLNINESEKLLEILTKSTFSEGIIAGIPSGVKSAHKFGERTGIDKKTGDIVSVELHDCGIVYKKDNPYILCIMTDGTNFDDLAHIIGGISSIIWNN